MQRELHIRILAAGSCRNLLALHEITTHDQLSVSLFKSYLNRWFLLNGRMPFRTVKPSCPAVVWLCQPNITLC